MNIASLITALKGILVSRLGVWVLGVLMVAMLLLLLWRRWKKNSKKEKTPKAEKPVAAPSMGRNDLVRLWRDFASHLPWEVRRYLGALQFFVLMGEAGSGKTRLVNTCTDWQGQSDQLHPSSLASPLMQFYLSSRAVVLEMGAAFLGDTSLNAHHVLERLGRALPLARPPHIVLALNGSTLLTRDPESLRRLAYSMRGKINLLARAAGGPLTVSLALTHMDQLPGYSQWGTFLETQGLALQASWNEQGHHPSLETALERYEVLLPRALTTVSTADFLAMVAFLQEAATWLGITERFVRVLRADDTFSPPPQLTRLTLHGQEESQSRTQAFQAKTLPQQSRSWLLARKHQIAASAILILAAVALGALFVHQRHNLEALNTKLTTLERLRPSQYDQLHQLFPQAATNQGLALNLIPSFFPEAEEVLRNRLTRVIRRHYLVPELQRLQSFGDTSEQAIYLLGLLYATAQNGLSAMILADSQAWAMPLGLPPQLVIDYARHNLTQPKLPLEAKILQLGPNSLWDPIKEQVQWNFLLQRLESVSNEAFLTPEILRELQGTSAPLLQMVQRIFAYPYFNDTVAILKKLEPFAFNSDIEWLKRRESLAKQQQLIDLVRAVGSASLDHPEVSGFSLPAFLKLLAAMPMNADSTQVPHPLNIGDRSFTVSLQAWQQLIIRSQMTLMMREFIRANQQNRGFIFFDSVSEFPDIWLNAANDGALFFVGQAKIDGRLSKEAFDKRVRPVVEMLDEQLRTLPITKAESERFQQAIHQHIGWYADRYVDAYRRYWMQFRISADSEASLRFVLNQILDFSSPFFEFLLVVHTNTALETGDNPMFRHLTQRLEMFRFVHSLMQQKDGVYPEWEKYKGFVSQMRDELNGETPQAKQEAQVDETAAFKSFLTPLGRISYAMQIEDPGSYLSFCRLWLRSTSIAPEWQAPFLDPFRSAYTLGKAEIEQSIAFVWEDLQNEYIDPLRGLFPFHSASQEGLDPKELERVLAPQGAFWRSFRLYLAPVCKESDGAWVERVAKQGVIALPQGMLADVNNLSRITRTLWDGKGATKAIVYRLQPPILPAGIQPDQVPVLSYLRLGANSVMAFNQRASWQELKVEWWKAEPAGVGVMFESPESLKRNQREVTVEREYWSLYRLLIKGRSVDAKTISWLLNSPLGDALVLEYHFKSDPWALFSLPDTGLNFTDRSTSKGEDFPDLEGQHTDSQTAGRRSP